MTSASIVKVTLTFDDGAVVDFLSLNDALVAHAVGVAPVVAQDQEAPAAAPVVADAPEVVADVPATDAPAA